MRLLKGHFKPMRCVAYLPNGNLVSGSEDRTVRIWDSSTWECIRTIKALTPVYALAVSPDGNRIAFAGRQPSNNPRVIWIRTYNVAEDSFGDPFEFPRGEGESVWRLSYSFDGAYLLAGSRYTSKNPQGEKGICFKTGEPNTKIPIASGRIYSLRFASQDVRYGIAAQNKALFFNSIFATEPTASYDLRTMWPGDVIFLPDSSLAVVAGGKYLFFLDSSTQTTPIEIKTKFHTIHSLAVSSDGRSLFVGGKPSGVEVYDTASRSLWTRYEFPVRGVYGVAVSPTGETIAIAGEDGLAVVDCDH